MPPADRRDDDPAAGGDARFADGVAARPLRLGAETPEDLAVLAALLQDAVGRRADAAFLKRKRRFVLLLNRFRWEDRAAAERARRPCERVRCALTVEGVLSARSRGLPPGAADAPLCLLDLAFDPGPDGAGTLRLLLAGGGEIALGVEALELRAADLSRPWPARAVPRHDGA